MGNSLQRIELQTDDTVLFAASLKSSVYFSSLFGLKNNYLKNQKLQLYMSHFRLNNIFLRNFPVIGFETHGNI